MGLHNETVPNNQQLRWRIETNSGSSSGSPMQQREIYSRLVIDRVEPGASGLFECVISSGPQESQLDSLSALNGHLGQRPPSSGPDDRLRKLFGLFVNGK